MPKIAARRRLDEWAANPDARPGPDDYKAVLIQSGLDEDTADRKAAEYLRALLEARAARHRPDSAEE